MSDTIKLFPYMATPRGIEVCFSRNGGSVEQKRFPAGTPREQIIATLAGKTLPPNDLAAEQEKHLAEAQKQRAADAHPAKTQNEDDLKNADLKKEEKLAELNMMRAVLKDAKVKGFQLFGEKKLRAEYAKLMKAQEA